MKVLDRQSLDGPTPGRPVCWTGPTDAVTAADVAASLAVRQLRPRPHHREDIWASARGHAWELLHREAVDSWPALCAATRNRALATARALTHWQPESSVRRGGFGNDGGAPEITVHGHDDPLWTRLHTDLDTRPGVARPSSALLRLRATLDRVVRELTSRGLHPRRARDLVEVVIDHPERRRGAARARRRLEADGLATVSAAALVALLLGYPTRGVPGLVERELRDQPGWEHPCVPDLLDLVVTPRGTRLRGMWGPLTEAAGACAPPAGTGPTGGAVASNGIPPDTARRGSAA